MSYISVTNFVNVSVSTPPKGFRDYQVNNLAIFTKETPVNTNITASNPGVYVSPADVAADWGSGSEVVAQANLIFAQSPNILDGSGQLIIFPMQSGDVLATVIAAGIQKAFFGGALYAGYAPSDAEILAAMVVVQDLRVKLFASSHLTASLVPTTGVFWIVQSAAGTRTRCLLYTEGATALNARKFAAAYAGRALSTDFNAPATTATMHLKTLVGITPDSGISQTILNDAITVGADTYPSVGAGAQYIGKVYSTGANDFFDNVYNLDWLVFGLQIAGVNALATTGTKLPQTEPGVAVLKGAYITVLQQAVSNGFIAPGAWNSSELFGNPSDLKRNILNLGYYVWSLPVNQQLQSQREQRIAPIIRIAVKYAGAIQKSNVVVSINA